MNEIQHLDTVVDNWSSNNESILDIELLAQGWSDLHYGCDIRGGRLRSGGREFGNGFGTHADSHIRIRSRKALRRFRAFGGAAENAFTAAMAEQIPGMIFAVAADGVRVAQSDELRYGMISEFDVELGGATTIELFIQSPSGTHLAHANWCDVTFETVDGEQIICGRARSMNFPLSFHYGKLDSADFTARYGLDHTRREMDDHVLHEFTSGPAELRMTLRCKAYREFPVLEWHTTFENCSDRRSEPLSQIRTLNLTCEPQTRPQLLRHRGSFHWDRELAGSGSAYSNAFRDSFRPVWWLPSAPEHIHFGGTGGRPSADWMPYFDLPDGETNWRAAVGWAGGAATAFFTRKKGLRSGTAYWIAGMFALVALLFTPYNLQLLMPTTNQQNISMICCIANIVFMLFDMWAFSFALLRGGARLAESEGLAGAVYACCAAAVATAPAFAAVAAKWPFAVCVGIYAALLTVLSAVKLFFPEEECSCDVAGGRAYAVSGIVTALFVAVLAGAYFITEAHIAL